MDTIRCKQCAEEKPVTDYYKSNRSRCKECVKLSVRKNRRDNIDYYREYDRKRSVRPDRVKARQEYYEENKDKPWYKKVHVETNSNYRRVYPEKARAREKVRRAIQKGNLIRKSCEVCGDPNSEAHHPDYSKPLEVMWLCKKHHMEEHVRTGSYRKKEAV